jgi:hypothetical protein
MIHDCHKSRINLRNRLKKFIFLFLFNKIMMLIIIIAILNYSPSVFSPVTAWRVKAKRCLQLTFPQKNPQSRFFTVSSADSGKMAWQKALSSSRDMTRMTQGGGRLSTSPTGWPQ